jgi:hypothetical protein
MLEIGLGVENHYDNRIKENAKKKRSTIALHSQRTISHFASFSSL